MGVKVCNAMFGCNGAGEVELAIGLALLAAVPVQHEIRRRYGEVT